MTETNHLKKRREVRIVGYDRRLLIAQIQLVAAVLILPAMALAPGWGAGLLCVVFFGLLLSVFAQLWKLRGTGLCVTVEDVESDTVAEDSSAEETPAEKESVEEPAPRAEPAAPEMHWSDMAYPDPDVELGLAEKSSEDNDAAERNTSGG